ncbi:MAG: DUF2065 family protein [Dokdonella sp.]
MLHDLFAALALVAVLEGLLLFAAPVQWKRMAEQLQQLPIGQLRIIGGMFIAVGVISLQFLR